VDRESKLVPSIPQSLQDAFAETVFNGVREGLNSAFSARLEVVIGDQPAAEGILETAQKTGAELITVGADSHPRRLMFYIGGVAHTVAQRATVPVLVFRPAVHELPHGGVRVLLADDGSKGAEKAAAMLSKFKWPACSEGWLIRVLEWLDLGTIGEDALATDLYTSWRTEYDRTVASARAHVFEELKAKRAELPEIFHATVPLVGEGHRIVEISEAMKREKIDLLVVGSRNLSPLQRFLGSTAEGLLRHAPCSILVVHEVDSA
jgi:nucleotide-binding universal stress UspA family protein